MPPTFDNVGIFFGSFSLGADQGGGVYSATRDTTLMANGDNDIVLSARPAGAGVIVTKTYTVNVNNAPPG